MPPELSNTRVEAPGTERPGAAERRYGDGFNP